VADLILECVREGRESRLHSRERLLTLAARIVPDNITANAPVVLESPGLSAVIANPSPGGVLATDGAALLGATIGGGGKWQELGAEPPDGTYVLARWDDAGVELLSDITASRTLWYACDEDRLIVSTSQRAIVALLGDFQLDASAVSWLLSAGSLGPDRSWDRRVRRLTPDSTALLDRRAWRLTVTALPEMYDPVPRSRREHLDLLRDATAWSCGQLDVDTDHWLLPLSGGMDSRTILMFMVGSGRSPRCLTWSTHESTRNPLSDAFIARLVARRYRVPHSYAYLDAAGGVDRGALQRFVELGEGRTDEFAGYVDGFEMWRALFSSGVSGVIRGDDPLGARARSATADGSRRMGGCTMVADYPEGHLVRRLGLADQDLPQWLRPQPGEGPEPYRDRMSHHGYIPNALAPLTSIKCRYLEVANPLLSRRLITLSRTLPDALRMYGRAFSAIVDPDTWPIPHARFTSTPDPSRYFADEEIIAAVVAELTSEDVAAVLTEEAAATLLVALASSRGSWATMRSHAVAAMKAARIALPSRLAYRLTPRFEGPVPLSVMKLAFRATLASKTVAMLRGDARALAGDDAGALVDPAPTARERATISRRHG
jgi:hypothetical protein